MERGEHEAGWRVRCEGEGNLVFLEEVDESVDVFVRDSIDDFTVVLHKFHHHLRRVQPNLALEYKKIY